MVTMMNPVKRSKKTLTFTIYLEIAPLPAWNNARSTRNAIKNNIPLLDVEKIILRDKKKTTI